MQQRYFRWIRVLWVVTLSLILVACAVNAGNDDDDDDDKSASSSTAEVSGLFGQNSDFVMGDLLPDAPELAARGPFTVGVRTLEVVNPNQAHVLGVSEETPNPTYDRPLTWEVWYPGIVPADQQESTTYVDNLRSGGEFTLAGRALRGAQPNTSGGAYPLVILSHGHPGSRIMLAYLGENLASKGYVVVSLDHTESTHQDGDAAHFGSTLLNRSKDQLFTVQKMSELAADNSSFLNGLVNANQTAIVGYSMGGYGALNSAGAGYSAALVGTLDAIGLVPASMMSERQEGNETYLASLDSRIKAIAVFAPWGAEAAWTAAGATGLSSWSETALAQITVPSLFVVGDKDDISFFEGGVQSLFEGAVNSDRNMLVYQNALHNVAPHPPPAAVVDFLDYERYSEPSWNNARLNNINQHFLTAFLGIHLKGEDRQSYLDLVQESSEGKWSVNEDGSFADDHTYWKGFSNRTALGMEMHQESAE